MKRQPLRYLAARGHENWTTAAWIALSVMFISLAFAPAGQFYLAWVGLVPFFIAVRTMRSQGRAMLWGWAGGIAFFISNMWWLSYVTWPGMFALMGYLGLYWGFAAMMLRGFGLLDWKSPLAASLLMGAVWTALDWLRGSYSMFGAHGLPWLYLGDTQTPWLSICQIADITGVYGVTFLLVFVNTLVAINLLRRERWRTLWKANVAAVLILSVCVGYGIFRIHQNTLFPGPAVIVVQPAYPQSNTGEHPVPEQTIVDFHVRTTIAALDACRQRGQNVNLVVWSETMMPPLNHEARVYTRGTPYGFFLEQSSQDIAAIAERYRMAICVGGTFANDWQDVTDPDGTRYALPTDHRNSAYFFNDVGLLSDQRYDKIQLLPFGEFVPFRESIPWLYRQLIALGPPDMKYYELTPGVPDALTVFPLDADANDPSATWRFVVPICFEDIVSPLVTDLIRTRPGEKGSTSAQGKRADFIVNLTNDGWFRGGERAQHLQAAVFRSIENRVPTARSVNMGISGFIDSMGRLSDLCAENTEGWSVHQLTLDHRVAIHTIIGELFADICAVVTGVAIAIALFLRYKRRPRMSRMGTNEEGKPWFADCIF